MTQAAFRRNIKSALQFQRVRVHAGSVEAWQLEQKLRTHIWNHCQETEMHLEMVQVLDLSLPLPVSDTPPNNSSRWGLSVPVPGTVGTFSFRPR